MKYYVTFKVDARYIAAVDANNIEEAKEKAAEEFSNADFGEANTIDGDMIIIENENGDYIWEK